MTYHTRTIERGRRKVSARGLLSEGSGRREQVRRELRRLLQLSSRQVIHVEDGNGAVDTESCHKGSLL